MVGLRSLLDIFIFLILLGLDQGTPKGAPFARAMSAQRHAVTPLAMRLWPATSQSRSTPCQNWLSTGCAQGIIL